MDLIKVCFWACAALVAYAYVGYPLLLALAGKVRRRHRQTVPGPLPDSVTVVLAAYNEGACMAGRLRELSHLVAASGVVGEIIVVSDGSTDDTADVARRHKGNVRVIEFATRQGKAAALNAAAAVSASDILVFADARQLWASDALRRLLENFADPAVGAVSGELLIESSPGVMAGVGFYWRYEKWLRRQESQLHSVTGVTGAISAVRRELFQPIPPDALLDDVYWPLCVALQGYRVVHDPRARAYDRLPEKVGDEFRRKVRTLSGNFQLLQRLPRALAPWHNPVWLQFVSHKLLRLLAPWALLLMLFSCALLPGAGYRALLGAQLLGYLFGLASLLGWCPAKSRLASAASSFLVLNGAAWLAFWVWLTGRAEQTWGKAHYRQPAVPPNPLLPSHGTAPQPATVQ